MKMNISQQPIDIETKSVGSEALDVASAFDEFMRAFESYRATNDQRLVELESRIGADAVTVEKMERIGKAVDAQKAALDNLLLKRARPAIGGVLQVADLEYKNAFDLYMRRGQEGELARYESKAMSYGSGADGGYLVAEQTSAEIGRRLALISPIRSVADIRVVSTAVYKKPFAVSGPASGWVAETDERPQTAAPSLAELQFPAMEIYAMPAATATLLDDAAVDLDAWIASEVETVFAEQEGAAFVAGDGVGKPHGFLAQTNVAEQNWSWGSLGYVATGQEGGFAAADPSDQLIETIYALKAGYRQNANWVMNRKTQAGIRKLKDGDGNYLWQPPAAPGQRAMLMGFPVVEAEDMPDIAAGSLAIAFGDFRRGYLIVDRTGVRVLRDPYSAKPYVLFYTTKRVGGGVQDFDAIKFLKFSAA
jgi:HK97 family phage major capsid protein